MFGKKDSPKKYKKESPNKAQIKLLPAGEIVGEYAQELTNARKLLSVYAFRGTKGEGSVKSPQRDNIKRAVAYHFSSTYVDTSNLELPRIFAHTPNATILLRALKRSPESFVSHIEREKSHSKSATKQKFFDDVFEWAFPVRGQQVFGHDMLIWGPSNTIVPINREETAALYGDVIKFEQLGSVIRSVLYGVPMDKSETWIDPATGDMDPIWYAASRNVLWKPRYYILPDVMDAYSFWSGLITLENIGPLVKMGDLLLRLEKVDKLLYFNAILRIGVHLDSDNDKPNFSDYSKQLLKLGKWEQLNGADVRKAFNAFVPGSAPQPSWNRHSVLKPAEVLNKISKPLKTVGDSKGNVMVGILDDQPLLLDPWDRPGTLIEGPSKTGKTTLGAAYAIQTTQNIVWLPLTATDLEESAVRWVSAMGGTVIDLNLPNAVLKSNNGTPPSDEAIQKKQLELQKKDRDDAKNKIFDLADYWQNEGKVTGFPLTFRILSGNTPRLFNWYDAFLNALLEVWAYWYTNYGEQLLVVADNFSALNKMRNQIPLGDIYHNAGKTLGNTVANFVSNARNNGIATWVLTHTIEDLAQINSGLYGSFGLHVSLKHDQHTYADIITPKDSELYASKVYITLPQPIKTLVERAEPKKEDKPWRQKVSSMAS